MSDDINHGTYAGYQKHRRQGIEICDECREANAEYHRELTARQTPGRKRAKIQQQARHEAAIIVATRHVREFEKAIQERLDAHGYDDIEARRGRPPRALEEEETA